MRVSKSWNAYLRGCHDHWHHLDFRGAPRKVRTASVRAYISFARTKITELTIDNVFDFDTVLQLVLRQCPIEVLRIGNSVPRLGEAFVDTIRKSLSLRSLHISSGAEMTTKMLQPFVRTKCSKLEELSVVFSSIGVPIFDGIVLPKLRVLNLAVRCNRATSLETSEKFTTLPDMARLQRLTLNHPTHPLPSTTLRSLSSFSELKDLVIHCSTISLGSLALPSAIQTLDLSISHDVDNVLTRLGTLSLNLPNLVELSLELSFDKIQAEAIVSTFLETTVSIKGSAEEGLRLIVKVPNVQTASPSALQRLSLSSCRFAGPKAPNESLEQIFTHPRLTTLKSLVVSANAEWNDEDMELVSKHLSSLEHLEITGSSRLTGVGIRSVIERIQLRSLCVNRCGGIAPDALAWARLQRPKFSYSME